MTLLRLVLRGLKPYWIWVLLVVLFQIVGVLAALYLPTLNADIIDDGVAKADVPVIWQLGRLMLVISFGNIIALVVANYFAARSAMRVGKDLRSTVFGRVSSFSPRELAEFGTPSLITRSTNDVQQVQMLVFFSLNMLVQAPVTGVGGVILALRVEPGMAWLIAVMVPVMLIAVGILIFKAAPLFKQMQGKIDDINGV
ncbi:MAG: ABC transporter permease, partial [Brachybacterium sp.]